MHSVVGGQVYIYDVYYIIVKRQPEKTFESATAAQLKKTRTTRNVQQQLTNYIS